MNTKEELQIVESAKCGDVNSFGELYKHYYTTMVWLAYSILKDYGLAEDTAQEAFACACDGLIELKRSDKFGPWLAAICRNIACQTVKQKSKEVILDEPSIALEQNKNPNPEKAVREAISSLHDMYREIVILRYYDKMSYEQIELLLGIPRSKVKGRLFTARRKIGKYLRSKGLNGDEEL